MSAAFRRPFLYASVAVSLLWSATALAVPPVNTGLFGHTAIKGYDPVAYFTDGKAEKGDARYSYDWMGATWVFVNQKDLDLFKQNPQRYAPQYGGYCAYAVAHNDTAGIDPDSFTVVGDKLYLNYSPDIKVQWEKQRDGFIRDADKHWPGLVGK